MSKTGEINACSHCAELESRVVELTRVNTDLRDTFIAEHRERVIAASALAESRREHLHTTEHAVQVERLCEEFRQRALKAAEIGLKLHFDLEQMRAAARVLQQMNADLHAEVAMEHAGESAVGPCDSDAADAAATADAECLFDGVEYDCERV